MFTNSNSALYKNSLKWFSAVWAVCIIAPLIYFPSPANLVGHPWKVELLISLILCLTLACYLFFRQENESAYPVSSKVLFYIIAPFCAFILWSAISSFWAGSFLSVAHHTLVWSCYLLFFLFTLHIISNRKLFKISVISLGLVVSIISVSSIIEFVSKEIIDYRYAKFAEIFAALMPLFFSFVLRLNRKYLFWSIPVTVFLWLGILFSLSRGTFLASVIGLFVFILLRIFTRKTFTEKRRLILAVLGIIFITFLTQMANSSAKNGQKETTFSRMAIQDENDPNSISLNARILFAGISKEMLFDNYLTGVGADNFSLAFNKYRAVFSADSKNKSLANITEEYLSERAHNEYLQILAELGITGGIIFLCLLGGIAKLGFAEIVKNRFERSNILTHSAIGGMVAFLVSSCFSSFSFRLMQNGLVFFFLLAILLRNFAVKKNQEKQNNLTVNSQSRLVFVSIALVACLSLTAFSALKATSQYFVYQAEKQENFETAQSYYKNASLLDPANASSNYSLGIRFLGEGNYQESAIQLQQAVDKGLNDSVTYSYLISAQTLANQQQQAINTASKAVEIFPYSVFMRVRYAALLDKFNEKAEAEKQSAIARQINKKQAETWRLLINYGSLKASEESRTNKEVLSLDKIAPNLGVYAILTERQIVHPEEKPTFAF